MSVTANDILEVARSQLGVKETPSGSNNVLYNTAYYGRSVYGADFPWCCAFVWWVFQQVCAALFYGGGKTAYCPAVQSYAEQHGQWVTSNFKPGDCVLFDFHGGGKGLACHIGIVESVTSTNITTIEGNTSVTSQDNGGAVMRRTRYFKDILGAFRPAYATEESEDDKMAKVIDDLAKYVGTTPDDIIKRLSVLCTFVNTDIDDSEKAGVDYLKNSALINSTHDPREPVAYGNFGLIMQRFKKSLTNEEDNK